MSARRLTAAALALALALPTVAALAAPVALNCTSANAGKRITFARGKGQIRCG